MIERYVIYGLLAAGLLGGVWFHGYTRGELKLYDYQAKQATETVRVVVVRGQVVREVEVKYRDRIKTIYVQGQTIEKEVIRYVTKEDDAGCVVPVGFVRGHTAAWSGTPAGPPAESDRGPSGVPLSEVAGAEAHNATACLAYKAQRDGLIEFYKRQQAVR